MKARHKKHVYRPHHKPGTAPGTLAVHETATTPRIRIIGFNETDMAEATLKSVDDIPAWLEKWKMSWINVDGIGDTALLESLGKLFTLHKLALEDVTNIHHRPKTEDFGDHLFLIMREALMRDGTLDLDQINLFAGKNFVLTIQNHAGDCLDPVRVRLRNSGRREKMVQPGYFAYSIVDTAIDGYFPVLEKYGEMLNELEDLVVEKPGKAMLVKIHDIKRDLRLLRQALWPMREMIHGFSGGSSGLVRAEMQPYLRDCYDHVIQAMDLLEMYYERASSLTEIYLSSLSNRMNEVMKVLTIIATIFMPLSFIASVFGMNFNTDVSPWNMPELNWAYGYPAALGLMLTIALGLVAYFRKKGWM